MGKQWKQWLTLFFWATKSLQMVIAAMRIKDACSLEEKLWKNLHSLLKKQRYHFVDKGPYSQSYVFSSSHVWMWELDYTAECQIINAFELEKTLESPLDCKEIKRVNPKRSQPWIFIGRTNAEAEAPVLWPPDIKNWLIGRDPDAGKDWSQEDKGMTEDEVVGWHHRLNGHELSKLWEMVKDRKAWCAAVHGVTKNWTWQTDNKGSNS